MPALPHPLTLEDRMLAANRWRARRDAWAQSLFVAAGYAVLVVLVLAVWLGQTTDGVTQATRWIETHAATLALAALIASAWMMRRRLHSDARRHARSSLAAAPIWRETQQGRDTRLRWQFALQLSLLLIGAMAFIAMRDSEAAGQALTALRWSWLAAVLALVFVPAPQLRRDDADTNTTRLASVPRWIAAIGSRDLPHLPQWWWQRAASLWMRGRAASALGFGLLVAPSEAAAIVVPVALLMLMALVNAIDVAHRLAGDIATLLADRPPTGRRLWRSLWPLHAILAAMSVAMITTVLHLLGLHGFALVAVAASLALVAQVDFLMALMLRHQPKRLPLARLQCVIVAAALASAFPPMLLVGAPLLWVLLMRRVLHVDRDA